MPLPTAETVVPPPPWIPAAFEEMEAKENEAETEFEEFFARLKGPVAPAPPPPKRQPLRSVPPPPKEEWGVRAVPAVRPAPLPSPSVRTPESPVSPPAATAGETEAKPPAEGTSFLGNLVLFPSEANVSPFPAEEKRPPEPPSAPSRGPRHEPPLAPPPEPPPAPPLDPVRASRILPTYNVSRGVQLDPEKMVENRCVAFFPDAPELEPYRVLRTRILQAAEKKGGNTMMITSALPREGKTVTAINLALTFSKTYLQTAMLVDCDLRQQRVHEVLGFESGLGLGDYLTDGCPVSDMIVWPGVEKLTLISGGKTVSESSELLGSPAMKALVEDMKNRYPNRYIFFDLPPVLAGADALAFAPLVDHILFVVRADVTPLPEVQKALEMLPKEKVIGLVLNRQKYL
jgi:non-specific protein-tyrosine kinase